MKYPRLIQTAAGPRATRLPGGQTLKCLQTGRTAGRHYRRSDADRDSRMAAVQVWLDPQNLTWAATMINVDGSGQKPFVVIGYNVNWNQ